MKLETLKTTVIGQRLVKAYQVLRQEQADEYVLTYPQGILGTAKYHQIQGSLQISSWMQIVSKKAKSHVGL